MFRTHAYTDYTFHYILAGEVAPETIGEIGEAIQEGIASFRFLRRFILSGFPMDICGPYLPR